MAINVDGGMTASEGYLLGFLEQLADHCKNKLLGYNGQRQSSKTLLKFLLIFPQPVWISSWKSTPFALFTFNENSKYIPGICQTESLLLGTLLWTYQLLFPVCFSKSFS